MMMRMRSTALLAMAGLVAMGALEGVMSAAKPAPPTAPPQATEATKATEATEATKKLYTAQCQACHGPDGKALLPDMSFIGRTWKHGTTTPDMVKVIADGVPGTMMMPFKGRLTEAQIRDLARYVRSLDPKLKPEKK